MVRTVAIVAHYDANNRLEDNFKEVVLSLCEVFEKVLVVTTSDIAVEESATLPGVEIVRRPNLGYDFYSYRAGLFKHALDADRVLLTNSSFILLDRQRFTSGVQRMLAKLDDGFDVVGATSSLQFAWHLQSYLLLLGGSVLRSSWFWHFIENIQPTNSKIELISKYEVGLSQELIRRGVKAAALFDPGAARAANKLAPARQNSLDGTTAVNPTHFLSREIAAELGIIKTEVVRDNPHQIDTSFLNQLVAPDRWTSISQMMERQRRFYRSGPDKMATLSLDAAPARRVHWRRANGADVAVVVHLYYSDLLEEICGYLTNIAQPFDVFVTTPFEADVATIINRMSTIACSVTVSLTENRGRDIAPFLDLYRSGALDRYTAVLKLHSKKSTYSESGTEWRRDIFRALAGNSMTVQKSVQLLAAGRVGVVGPHKYYLTAEDFWGANDPKMRQLVRAMGFPPTDETLALGFFAGSMFWFAPAAFKPLQTIAAADLVFEAEAGQQDGTLAHALERLFAWIARKSGYRTTSVRLEGEEIHQVETSEHRVPVL
jgi:lipopolysaccharide biosynthesis protein